MKVLYRHILILCCKGPHRVWIIPVMCYSNFLLHRRHALKNRDFCNSLIVSANRTELTSCLCGASAVLGDISRAFLKRWVLRDERRTAVEYRAFLLRNEWNLIKFRGLKFKTLLFLRQRRHRLQRECPVAQWKFGCDKISCINYYVTLTLVRRQCLTPCLPICVLILY
jgi:hypothetical protein